MLLVHGLGGSVRSWDSILPILAGGREVILVDLPGHGGSPALPGRQTIAAHADALEHFIDRNGLAGVDTVGSSVGARLVLELARRGIGGHTVAYDPGGFWRGWETAWFRSTLAASVRLVRLLRRRIPALSHSRAARAVLLAQLSARPGALDPLLVRNELTAIAETDVFDAMLRELARGPLQEGTATPPGRVTIGWGRQDRLLLPRQAERAQAAFPTARLHWFERCGHFPQWDRPKEAAEVILKTMARSGADNGRDLSRAVQLREKVHDETEITRADVSFVRSTDLHLRK
ncbi:alpha/beta fold hydrolase [Palleronia pelagia]|uniref:Pimeloyl-ACP methyl ester carboxylesterase n=1 Tax=Palleronia pelagia TaxID=387096 RepID=A0A1H8K9N1_9RHOB|nr:alpha/beta fold hydrolase [Palleronia pelagia]SEN89624.1 Pimeloyl-ACP methyl ester carboxylesterase [Palleronia pelagia]